MTRRRTAWLLGAAGAAVVAGATASAAQDAAPAVNTDRVVEGPLAAVVSQDGILTYRGSHTAIDQARASGAIGRALAITTTLGLLWTHRGRPADAESLLTELVSVATDRDLYGRVPVLRMLGARRFAAGDVAAGTGALRRAVVVAHASGDEWEEGMALNLPRGCARCRRNRGARRLAQPQRQMTQQLDQV